MRVLIGTGSSGGHIFPALALADSLKDSGHEVLLVLPQKDREHKLWVASGQIKYIHAAKITFRISSKNIAGLWFLLLGAWQSLRIIIKFKPDVVVGFGSLNTVALIFWAWLFRIKTMIHEQNVTVGTANRVLAKLVDKVAVSFAQTRQNLNIAAERIVVTGNPLRQGLERLDKKEVLDFFQFKEGKLTVLITGGSQGSHRLNTVCLQSLLVYLKKDNLQVIHICGRQDFSWLKDSYAASALTYKLFDFYSQMQYAYSVADLVICRAGATTVAELQKFKIPAILVPYPFAHAHQLANAEVLGKIQAAWIISDQELTPEILSTKFKEFSGDPQKLESMRRAYLQLDAPDATELLAKEVLSLV
ncbi:MAG: undecaprenyldiphospho-muramoylpentapeptide beta-N-acetylglucosaminyltransferase [Candidatus Omnitrophica bacterium CG11_big_fil_rev_8_21_14_0_20_43_6]|nr:MAG: undecaprenyldiphospho-muramoylpentapeptide beta-N-acetylglucosaminyltransferase [Candidatus Omnitrophica bacterium CG11_big_fil_rev_8_21_14_0_20_43_6]